MNAEAVLNALLSGSCWMVCAGYEVTDRFYVGVAVSDGANIPLYSCRSCIQWQLDRILRGTPFDMCWLWCGRSGLETAQIGSIEIFPFSAHLQACGDCIRLVLQAIQQASYARDSAGYRTDGTRRPLIAAGDMRAA